MLSTATLTLLAALAAAPEASHGVEFRVETEIQDAQGQVVDRHLWLFQGATALDVRLPHANELVLFDHAAGQIVLIDRTAQRQAVVGEAALVRLMAELRAEIASEGKDEQFATAARPTPLADGKSFTVQAGPYLYHATAVAAPDAAYADAFGRASNNAARLNALEGLGLPPFAGMALREAMTARGMLPGEITLRWLEGNAAGPLRVRHLPAWQLTAEDRRLLQAARQMRADYPEVAFSEFRTPSP